LAVSSDLFSTAYSGVDAIHENNASARTAASSGFSA
jgi:hypothetical protein